MNRFVFVRQRNAEKGITPGSDRIEKILLVDKINPISQHYETNGRRDTILVDLHLEMIGFHLYWCETDFIKCVCFGNIQKDDGVFNTFVIRVYFGCVGVGPCKPWFVGMFA